MRVLQTVDVVDGDNPDVGDLLVVGNSLVLTDDLATVTAQRLRVRLRFLRGEWFADTRLGIPYLGELGLLGSRLDETALAAIFRPIVAGTPGVARVVVLAVTLRDRVASITFEAALSDGAILNSDDFPPFVVELP